jgi:hypothetical protein
MILLQLTWDYLEMSTLWSSTQDTNLIHWLLIAGLMHRNIVCAHWNNKLVCFNLVITNNPFTTYRCLPLMMLNSKCQPHLLSFNCLHIAQKDCTTNKLVCFNLIITKNPYHYLAWNGQLVMLQSGLQPDLSSFNCTINKEIMSMSFSI